MNERRILGMGVMIILVILLGCGPVMGKERTQDVLFSTWDIFEVDKLASIWLIKRFINPEATIRFYHNGESITEGIPFDTPDAHFRRYYNASTFAVLMKDYRISDPQCRYILKIVQDIEINTWETKKMPESRSVNQAILQIIGKEKNPDEIIAKSMQFFDALYAKKIHVKM